MSSKLLRILLGVLALFVVLILGIQVYIAFSRPYSLETVIKAEVDESFAVKGIVSREEQILETPKSGSVDYLIRNGDKVAKNSPVAHMYPSETDIGNMSKVAQLEAELETVKESQKPGSTAGTQAAALNRQIDLINGEYVTALLNHDIASLYDLKNSYLGAFNRSQIVFASAENFDARIAELEAEIASLRAKSGQSVSSVVSPVSGYFVNSIDGYEELINNETAQALTEEEIEAFFTGEKPAVNESVTGKVIVDAKWRYTTVVSAKDAVLLKEGRNYDLLFDNAADETVSAKVLSNSYEATKGTAVVVFETDILSEKLVKLRAENARVIMKTHKGIKIPKSALRIVDGKKGVYIKYGQVARFKLVDILYENEEYMISDNKSTDAERQNYVRVYDDVFVKGTDLYDGKQLG